MAQLEIGDLRRRIVERGVKVRASELVRHPLNPNAHPERQQETVAGSMQTLGILRDPLVYRLPDGRYGLVDGHLRSDLLGERVIEVDVTDLTEAEARLALRLLDGTVRQAETDAANLDALLTSLRSDFDAGDLISDDRLDALIGAVGEDGNGLLPETDPDEVPPENEVPARCQPGDLWELPAG